MSDEFDKYWNELVAKYRRVEGLAPSLEEIESEIERMQAEPLNEEEIDRIVSRVSSGEDELRPVVPEFDWLDTIDTSSVEEGILQLNRNKGKTNEDIEKRLDELRKKALGEDDNEDDLETD